MRQDMCIGRIIVNSTGAVCASCHCHRRAALRCGKYDSVTIDLVAVDLLEPYMTPSSRNRPAARVFCADSSSLRYNLDFMKHALENGSGPCRRNK